VHKNFRCPALTWDRTKKKAVIDDVICAGCSVCYSICPQKAIEKRRLKHEKVSGKRSDNIIITGVGGQGNVMASRVLAGMLVNAGYVVTIGETFGMSQRGGSVMSHLRVSSKSVLSPQIPQGNADIVIALEPVEALRVLTKYGNPDVAVLTNSRMVYPMGVITGEFTYPTIEEVKSMFEKISAKTGSSTHIRGGGVGQSRAQQYRDDRSAGGNVAGYRVSRGRGPFLEGNHRLTARSL